jgi:hypothetical protein
MDDADYDDLIVRITSTSTTVATSVFSALSPHWISTATVAPPDDQPAPSLTASPRQPRGPPAA